MMKEEKERSARAHLGASKINEVWAAKGERGGQLQEKEAISSQLTEKRVVEHGVAGERWGGVWGELNQNNSLLQVKSVAWDEHLGP